MKGRCLYLIQSAGKLPNHYPSPGFNRRDAIYLTWKEAIPGATFLPNSTWASGRNWLLAQAKQRLEDYEYFIFLDEDVYFLEGDFDAFERALERFCPAIAVPFLEGYHGAQRSNSPFERVHSFDAIMTAFHRDLIRQDLILPYLDIFDHLSWWTSQLIVIYKCAILYPAQVFRFDELVIKNFGHGKYPRNFFAPPVWEWLLNSFFQNNAKVRSCYYPYPTHRFPLSSGSFKGRTNFYLTGAEIDLLLRKEEANK